MWLPSRSDANRAVQAQKMAGDGKFWIKKVEELYYPCSENKGADQLRSYCEADLRSYREADLRLYFRLGRLLVFPCGGSGVLFIHFLPGLMKQGGSLLPCALPQPLTV